MSDVDPLVELIAELICGRRYRPSQLGFRVKTDNPTDYTAAKSVLAGLEQNGYVVLPAGED